MRRHILVGTILIFTFYAARIVSAQLSDIQFDHISIEQGLSNFSISDIIQDQQGYLWFGTEDGLNKFDGYKFTIYKPDNADSNSLPGYFISNLYIDYKGDLWIVVGSKLCRYNPQSDTFELFTKIFPNTNILSQIMINCFLERKNGEYLIGTVSGLYSFNIHSKILNLYWGEGEYSSAISNSNITVLYEDEVGDLWIGTADAGIYRYNCESKRFINYRSNKKVPSGLSTNFINCITEDHQGTVWIGTNKDLHKYDRYRDKVIRFYHKNANAVKMISDFIFDLYSDSKGYLWIGTFNSGLFQFQPEKNVLYQFTSDNNKSYSLSQNRIHCIYEDLSGVMWFGTYRGGLNRYSHKNDAFIRCRVGGSVYSILLDSHGDLLIGTGDSGLLRYDKNGNFIRHYHNDPKNPISLSNDNVMALYEDNQGQLWVGTGDGLNRYDAKNDRFFRYKPREINSSLPGFQIKTIHGDKSGNLWLGTKGYGLCYFDRLNKTFTKFQNDPSDSLSLSNNDVWAIASDLNDNLWLGTFGGGINLFNRKNQKFKRYMNDPLNPYSLNNNAVYSLYVDPRGFIWAGTFGGGLNVYDPFSNRFFHYSERDGLPDNFVKSILADNNGNVWVGTDKGLSRFIMGAREQSADQDIKINNYSKRDGLISNVFLSGAFFNSSDGKLWFGGEGGCISFYPDSIKDHRYIPPVIITSFTVFDKKITLSSTAQSKYSVKLSHKQNFFSFEFAALDYTEPAKNKYAYQLIGFDNTWINSGTRRYASYTDVDPGDYVFHVKGSNSDGKWNEVGASAIISITPPFWKTWWFRLTAALFTFAVILGIYKYRVNHLLAMERLRTRLAADLHDDVAGNLSSIATYGKIIQDETGNKKSTSIDNKHLLQRIISLSQESVTSIREIIWAIDPKLETLHDLLLRVHDHAINACRGHNMILKFEIPAKETIPSKNLSPEQRKHLWLIFKEAIHNAVIHSNGSNLTIEVMYKIRHLHVNIRDNGCGFGSTSDHSQFSGKGIGIMKDRIKQLGGIFNILSTTGKGTTLNFRVRI